MKLFAGPWVGEFGWEIMRWQGFIRKMSHKYDEVIVSSRPGHEYLYKDFATQFIPLNAKGMTDCQFCYGYNYNNFHRDYINEDAGDVYQPVIRLLYKDEENPKGWHGTNDQEFIKFGMKTEVGYDVLYHIRATTKCASGNRNWSVNNWRRLSKKLLQHGLKIACVGSKTASSMIVGFDDLRGIPLEELCNVMASSKVIVGPSSGPMHLASLCGLHHVVLTFEGNYNRYKTDWNPLHTTSDILIDENWNPPVEDVYSAIMRQING